MKIKIYLIYLFVILIFEQRLSETQSVSNVSLPNFLPFGTAFGDRDIYDGYYLTLGYNFPFLTQSYTLLRIGSNGLINFNYYSSYIPMKSPNYYPTIAPYWTSPVYFYKSFFLRQVYNNSTEVAQIKKELKRADSLFNSSSPMNATIVTWYQVKSGFSLTSSPNNTFQCVLATNGMDSYLIFNYDNLTWPNDSSVFIGYDTGDQQTYFMNSYSFSNKSATIYNTSNVNITGKWIHRVSLMRVTLKNFLPFGQGANDNLYSRSYTSITFDSYIDYLIFNQNRKKFVINSNGFIELDKSYYYGPPSKFPLRYPVIAPYWSEQDFRFGYIFYRETNKSDDLDKIKLDLVQAYSNLTDFKPKGALIFTWYNVTESNGNNSLKNTFQAIITTNGSLTYLIYNYDRLEWPVNQATIKAEIGYDPADSNSYYLHPYSFSSNITNIASYSNVNKPGKLIFQIGRVKDFLPPEVKFNSTFKSSKTNCLIQYSINKPSIVSCYLLINAYEKIYVNCSNNSAYLADLKEGTYYFYVNATSIEANQSTVDYFTWKVDLTKPSYYFFNKPDSVTNKSNVTFYFYCPNEIKCTYECYLDNNLVANCSEYREINFYSLKEKLYNFTLRGIDDANNTGDPFSYLFLVDLTPPVIKNQQNLTLACGGLISNLSLPYATDNNPNFTLTYTDETPVNTCATVRRWTARDQAGSSSYFTQTISYSSSPLILVTKPARLLINCEDLISNLTNLNKLDSDVKQQCPVYLNISYKDSSSINKCDIKVIRSWIFKNSCNTVYYLNQTIEVKTQSDPVSPVNGATDVAQENLFFKWYDYPYAVSYRLYIWEAGTTRPTSYTPINWNSIYIQLNIGGNKVVNWQVETLTSTNLTVIGPVWVFRTRAYIDLIVTDVTAPPIAYTGTYFQV